MVDGAHGYGYWTHIKRCPSSSEVNKAREEYILHMNNPKSQVSEPIVVNYTVKNDGKKYMTVNLIVESGEYIVRASLTDIDRSGKVKWLFDRNFATNRDFKIGLSFNQAYDSYMRGLRGIEGESSLYSNLQLGFPQECNLTNIAIENDDGLWTIAVGVFIGAVIAAIIRRRRKPKNTKNKEKDNPKEKKKEEAEYILQISRDTIQLVKNKPSSLTIHVWKVTDEGKFPTDATIGIENNEKALQIRPVNGKGTLKSKLTLKDFPSNSLFTITVVANAGGHTIQKNITLKSGEKQIVIRTTPDNKKTLRPNIDQLLSCYAKVIDENGKDLPKLTKNILFKPQSDWIDLSDPVLDDGWVAINIGASDPNAIAAVSHPPKSILLSITMEETEKNKPILRNDLEIELLDCVLDTSLDSISFPVTKEKSKITFKAYIKNCDGSKAWKFNAGYKANGYEDDSKPLTTIDIEKVSDIEVNIVLEGPILLPQGGEQYLRKMLLIETQQEKEVPLLREIYVMVSKEGLFVENGLDENSELPFTATGDIEKRLEFGLYKFDSVLNEIVADEEGLKELKFELVSTEKKLQNFDSVLQPEFEFDTLVTTVPHASYLMKSFNEIPGYGNIINLNYRATALVSDDTPNPDRFQIDFLLKVKTLDTGKRIPTWQEAYDDCKYIINNYVPEGNPRNRLNDLLEKRKVLLDAEGLVELRKQMWKIAYNLILADGAEGYKSVDEWASAIVETLEWTKWAGDICFSVLMAIYFKKFGALGGLGATGAGMLKGFMVDALVFYINDQGTIDDFKAQQYGRVMPMLMNMAQGRIVSVDNIQLFVKDNKPLAWAVFISLEFSWNLYNTKSMIEAAKATLRNIRDEVIVKGITGYIVKNPVKSGLTVEKAPQYKSVKVRRALKKLEKNIKENRIGGKFLDKGEVLEIMKDPALVRTIKQHGSESLKKAFDGPRKKIYQEHDRALIHEIAKKENINPKDLNVDDFRTPGTKGYNLNTDRDYRLLRRHTTSSGKEIWLEVPRAKWLSSSYKKIGELTGKPPNVTDRQWANQLQQRGTDKYDDEACADYSDHALDKYGKKIVVQPNIIDVENGKNILIDPEGMGKMYKNKVINTGDTPEAFAQAKKGVHTIEKVRKGYKKQGYQLQDLDPKLKKAIEIIEKSKVTIESTAKDISHVKNGVEITVDARGNINHTKKLLKKLGYKNGVSDVMKYISREFSNLKDLKPPGSMQKVTGFLFN